MNLSKSRYCDYVLCPKRCWLNVQEPELAKTDEEVQRRFEEGDQVGALAQGLFGAFTDVTTKLNGKLDLVAMIAKTQEAIKLGAETICEASFSKNGLYCAVDILHNENGGYAIYEVKSSNSAKPHHYTDVAFQKYLLEKCGITVTGTYIIHLNKQYVRQGELEAKFDKLFVCEDISEKVAQEIVKVEEQSQEAMSLLDGGEPEITISTKCNKPHKCDFWDYCTKDFPKPSVLDVYYFSGKWELIPQGIRTFEEVLNSGCELTDIQRRQIDFALNDRATFIDTEKIKEFLKRISYPIYFLDFETVMPALPIYDGTHPHLQITFQYSLHFIESENGELKHKEFLGEPETDPRRKLAEQLVNDIPKNVSVVSYSDFEEKRIKELAEAFPDLSEHLLKIAEHIVDMLEPFANGYYYNRAMGGSFSIKSVLPAIYPNDPELDYHNLEGVHNGSEAMTIFLKLKDMPPEERERTRQNLLKYCKLDTYAMVKIWQELVRISK